MSLCREKTVKQFKDLRDEILKQGGDIGDKTNNKFVANQVTIEDPFDEKSHKIATIEDMMSIPEKVMNFNEFNEMNEKKSEDNKLIDNNTTNNQTISNYKIDRKNTIPSRQFLIAGKYVEIGKHKGFVKRIVGDKVYLECGMEEVEIPISKAFK